MAIQKTNAEKAKINHLKNMLTVALADGKIHENEKKFIAAFLIREGIDESEVENILINPNVEFVVPSLTEDKVRYLKDLVCLMMVDGNIDENELQICKLAALSYGFKPEVIDAMILQIIADIS